MSSTSLDERLAALQKERVIEIVQGGRTGEKVLELALSAIMWAEQVIGMVESANTLPQPIACEAGCHFCCFNQVELTPPEALFLGHYVEQGLSDDEKKELLVQVDRSLDLKAGRDKIARAKIRNELPCPLLKDHKCRAYPARPLMCRAMHSLDMGQCRAAFDNRDLTSPPYYAHRHEIYLSISRGMLVGCRAVGCQSAPLELAQGLRDFFAQPQPLERWIQGEAVFSI